MRRQERCNHNKIKSHNYWVGNSQTGEQLYHRSPPTGVKVLSPTSVFPTWGSGNGRRNSQRIDFEVQRDLIPGLQKNWGKQRLHSWRAQSNVRTRTQGEGAVTPQETESDLPASVGGSPAEAGDSCGSPWGQGHWQQKFWKVLLGMSPPGVCHQPH